MMVIELREKPLLLDVTIAINNKPDTIVVGTDFLSIPKYTGAKLIPLDVAVLINNDFA